MTKIFDLIHLNNYMYMVDKEAKIQDSKLLYDSKARLVLSNISNSVVRGYELGGSIENLQVILASNSPSLELPILPAIEEDVVKLAEKDFDESWLARDYYSHMEGFKLGYKAATKKYTEGDMRKAIQIVFHETQKGSGGYTREVEDHMFDLVSQSLNPLPIAIEVETEDACDCPFGRCVECIRNKQTDFHNRCQQLKEVNNIIQVKRWIYG